MPFTAHTFTRFEILHNDSFGTAGITRVYRTATLKATGCDRHHAQAHTVSNDVSAFSVAIFPLGTVCGADVACNTLLLLWANRPVDLRFGANTGAALSGVRHLGMGATISALYITTGSQATTVLTELVGGSNTTITQSDPFA
jgi:hypothetical protein